ncbi:MAG: DUF429 domain-containing protein [Caldilinea sp.]
MNSPVFIGLDLAWSTRNRTGGAVIRDGVLIAATGLLTDDASIEAFIAAHLPDGAPTVIGVDAPLRVPNQSGRRRADHEVSLAWGKFDAGAYPANRNRLAVNGVVRGEALVQRLADRFDCVESAPIPHHGMGRYICEVYPHPAHVTLFRLERTLKYKYRPKHRERRLSAFREYQRLLSLLHDADPPLTGIHEFAGVDVSALRGQSLKAHEDQLDAVTCAYVAYYAWHHGPTCQDVYGSVPEGHILVPSPPLMT